MDKQFLHATSLGNNQLEEMLAKGLKAAMGGIKSIIRVLKMQKSEHVEINNLRKFQKKSLTGYGISG